MKPLLVLITLLLSNVANGTLIDRGHGLIYDDVLNVTWVQDANLCVALGNCTLDPSFNGVMGWSDASAWADNLVYGGFNDWHLPSVDVNGDGLLVECSLSSEAACRDNQLGYMYYYNLTPLATTPPTKKGTELSGNRGSFNNIEFGYWSSTPADPSHVQAITFWFSTFAGGQFPSFTDAGGFHAWAIRDGDVIPEPSVAVFIAFALLAFGVVRRNALASGRPVYRDLRINE